MRYVIVVHMGVPISYLRQLALFVSRIPVVLMIYNLAWSEYRDFRGIQAWKVQPLGLLLCNFEESLAMVGLKGASGVSKLRRVVERDCTTQHGEA